MGKDFITINVKEVRVEVNWNAIVAFLETSGQDNLQALTGLTNLKPSDIAGLMAASINEGEALEGRESSLTAQDIGRMDNAIGLVSKFLDIFVRQTTPDIPPKEGKE
jgi:hypothetical protein